MWSIFLYRDSALNVGELTFIFWVGDGIRSVELRSSCSQFFLIETVS